MAKRGIEDIIAEMEIFIANCKLQKLSASKIIVPKDDIDELINELKLKLPNEIERCKKIMRNKEAILADARTRADSIITESVAEANKLVDQSQIVELANLRANEILELARNQAEQIVYEANSEAMEIRMGSMQYTKDKLEEMGSFINATLEAEQSNYKNLIESLESNAAIIASNTKEMNDSINALNGVAPTENQPAQDTQEEDNYNVYGKTEYSDEEDDEDFDDDDDDFLDD